jgi:hypothetical protein
MNPLDNPFVHKEFFNTLIGKQLGRGVARTTYAFSANAGMVIKVETKGNSYQNVREWEYWNEMKDTPVAKWLAPCLYISPCGAVLVQERVQMIEHSKYPKKIPAFFTDTKYQNFGMLNGKFVCFDYGNIPFAKGISTKMQNVKWWSDLELD